MACGKPFLDRLPLPTIPQQPGALELDGVFAEAARRNPGLHGAELVVGVFADVTSEAVAEVLVPTLEELRPDLIVYEGMDVGAGVAASVLGIPAVPYAIALTHMGFALIHPAAMSYRRDLWTGRGQQPPDRGCPARPGPAGPHASVAAPVQRTAGHSQDPDSARRVRGERRPAAGLVGGAPHPTAGLPHLGHRVVRRGGGVEPGDQRDLRPGRRPAGRGGTRRRPGLAGRGQRQRAAGAIRRPVAGAAADRRDGPSRRDRQRAGCAVRRRAPADHAPGRGSVLQRRIPDRGRGRPGAAQRGAGRRAPFEPSSPRCWSRTPPNAPSPGRSRPRSPTCRRPRR